MEFEILTLGITKTYSLISTISYAKLSSMLGRKESSEGRSAHAISHRFRDIIFRPKELPPLNRLFGNASLEDADIIGFAEAHNPEQYKQISMHISHLARPGDIVLIEGYEYGIKVPKKVKRKHYHVPKFVRMEGWENINTLKIALDKQEEAKKLHNAFFNLSRNGSYIINMHSAWRIVETATKDYLLFAGFGRNPHLINSVRDAKERFPESKIFLIAGAKHFTEDTELISALSEYNFTIQQINNE